MTRRRPSITALAAVLGGLLLFVSLLSGHCPRPVLAPHPTVATTAVATIGSGDAVVLPANPSCVLHTPAAIAATSAAPAHAPQLLSVDASADLTTAADLASTVASSRAPPPPGASSTIDLCVIRV
jgi:hypothetical protein